MLAIPSPRSAALLAVAVALACSSNSPSDDPAAEALSTQRSALGGPDLWVQSVVAPPSALPNSAVQVTVTVCNQGDSPGNAPVWIFRSTDAVIATTDVQIGSSSAIGSLLPGACNTAVVTANIPAQTGTFYLGAYTDPSNALVEPNESNNALAAPKTTAVGSKPDFIVTAVSGPPSVLSATSFPVSATLCNQGTTSGTTQVGIYLSTDNNITTADSLVGTLAAPPALAPGACATLTGNANSNNGTNAFWLGAIADRSNTVSELLETNNALVGNQIGVGSKPDFIVTAVSGPISTPQGASFPVTATMCNQGTGSGTAPVTFYVSADATITSTDTQVLQLAAPPALAPGACTTLTGTASTSAATGAYWLGAIANASQAVAELNKTNDAKAGNRMGVGNAPDFYVTSVTAAATSMPGSPIAVSATVCNQGTQGGSPTVGIVFSYDDTITVSDWFAGLLPTSAWLLPGACDVVSGTLSAPGIVGFHYAGAIADYYGSTAELIEDNNARPGTRVAVGYGPDLVVTSVSTAPSALPGSQLTVTATTCNQGTLGGFPTTAVYFSTDATITTADLLAGDLPQTSFLEPGECDTESMSVWAPPVGVSTVGAIADRFGNLAELWESNNATAGNLVAVGNGPDFTVTSVTSSASAQPGGSVQVTATLCNQGTLGAGAPVVEAYFSTDATITSADLLGGAFPPAPWLDAGACATVSGTFGAPPSGTYFAGVIADRANSVAELVETNNATAAGKRLAVGYGPDLVVTALSTSPTVSPGNQLAVTATVCNQGTSGSSAPLDLYFSTDAFISINDWPVGNLPSPWLDAGACATVTGSAWAPGTQGTYVFGAIVDQWNGVPELFDDNNTFSGARVGVGNAPDFYVRSVSTAPSAMPGAQVTVTATVCNQGTVSGSTPVTAYFSTNDTITTADFLAGALPPFNFLLPGACEVLTGTFPTPPSGTYRVGAIADPGGGFTELFKDNNALAGNVIAVGNGPDLIISSVSTAASAMPGSSVQVTATVCNQGTQGSNPPVVEIVFSPDATITGTDFLAGVMGDAPYLDPGSCATQTRNVTLPPNLGTYFVGAIADRQGSIPELIEGNNALAGNQIAVGYGPDFVVTSVTSAPSATPGGSIAVTATLCNQGTQGAGAPLVELFFSRDTTITGDDTFGGPLWPPPPYLNPGECATLTSNAQPPPQPGTYYPGTIIDRFNYQPELRKDNNTTAGNRIGVDYAPDFTVASVSTAVTASPGSMVEVKVKVCNQGTQGGSAPLDIFFSTDAFISVNDYQSTSLPMPWLEAGACATVTGMAWVPGMQGIYYVGAIADSFGGVHELFKDNNAGTGNRVGVGNSPDFYVKSVSTAASALPGGQLTVTATVCNQGTVAGSAPTVVYFSTDSTIDQTDYMGGALPPFSFLLPGYCEVLTGTFPAPPPGAWYVGASVDPGNSTAELFEDNNTKPGNRAYVGNAADFIVSSVSTAPSALPGSQVTLTATVCNQGTQFGTTPLDLFFSTDATITTSDLMAWSFPPENLQPGACVTKTATVGAPPQGTYWVGGIADRWNGTLELAEDNNAKAGTVLVVGYGADFVVTSITAAPSATPGSTTQVTATLCNQGTQGAGAPLVELFFSTDTTITGEDFFAGPAVPPPPYLEAGACATLLYWAQVPPMPGAYYAGTIIDRLGYQPELRKDNNATAGSRMGVGYSPDFTVASVSTAVTASPGNMVEVTVKVCNQGTQGGSAPMDIFFSTDDSISVLDFQSTSMPMPYLDPGTCTTVIGNAWVPGMSGIYYIGAIVDSFGGMQELFKDNNALAGNRISVGNAPDFYVASVSTAPAAMPGSQVTVTARICNQGTVAGSTPAVIYFSTDAVIDQTDYMGGALPPIPFILPGGCDVVTGTFPAPPQGTWYVGAVVDPGNSTFELFEDNDVLVGNQLGVGYAPDFVISSVSTAPSAFPGAQVTVTATLCNQGTVPDSARVDVFFSTDATITTTDQFAWSFPTSAMLQPGECVTQSQNVPAPPPGTYWVGAIADPYGWTNELLENNNAKAGNVLAVGFGPNFVVTSLVSAPSATPGSSAPVAVTLCNQGTQGAPPPVVEVYYSRDTTITAEDFRAGPLPPAPWLDAGACATLTGNLSVPYNAGTYYAGAITDGAGVVPELREDDNTTVGSRIGVGYGPDFTVSSVSTAATVSSGGMLQVTAVVCNQGTQGGSAPLDIFFSTDDYVSITDYQSTSLPMPYLDPGTCSTVTGNAWAPGMNGIYFIGAIADSFGGMQELFKDNNWKAGNRVGVGNAPDFYVSAVSTAPSVTPGGQLAVTATICNQGTVAGGVPAGVYLSNDTTITTMDYFGGALPPIPFILPGTCDVTTMTVPAPPQGTWYVGVIVDPWNSTTELFEDNNVKAGNRVGVGVGVDLVVSSVSAAPSAMPGSQVNLAATLCNQGTMPGSGPVDLFFSQDATITTADLIAWSFPPPPPLQPGECTTLSATVAAPPPGVYWTGAIADSGNFMPELFDDNNATAGSVLAIGSGPNFAVTSITAAPSATPGSSASVAVTLCNQGTQGAPPPVVEVYYSQDTTITAGDFRAGPLPPPPFLDAGACATLTGTLSVPYDTGTYFAGAITDGAGAVPELREDDNVTLGSRIGVGYGPDYVVTAVSTDAPSAYAGGQLQVTATVCNRGTQGGSTPLDIYFSTDGYISVADYLSTSMPTPYLDPGACATVSGSAWAPYSWGTYDVGAIADSFGGMQELFKDNNARTGNVVGVGNAADLVVTAISGPATAQPWMPIAVTATVCNQGTVANDAGRLDVVLSTDATITAQDFYAGSLPPAGVLQPGACATVNGTVTAAGAGTYTLGGIADGANTSSELREDNNTRAGATALVIAP
ncbi:MAG TPA: CARDB domain-containing protein [Myxococcaceae bacterium]|nr:CARDB domain-containing protein [Myxococcaceae bacterium]